MAKFDPVGVIKEGWGVFKKNVGVVYSNLGIVFMIYLAFWIVEAIVNILGNNVSAGLKIQGGLLSIFLSLVDMVVSLVITLGLLKIWLDLVDGKKFEWTEVFSQIEKVVYYFLASVLVGLIIIGGFILLIVPGIIFAMKLQFVAYLMVDKGLGPIEAIKESWRMTNGQLGKLFIFGLLIFLFNFAGLILLVVGLVITIPVSSLALAVVYRKLSS